jgi:hypothetical protein
LVSKYGFIRAIFFPASGARAANYKRLSSHLSLPRSAVKGANAVVVVGGVNVVAVGQENAVVAVGQENAVVVRRGSVESVLRVRRVARGPHVHRESRESVPHVPRESVLRGLPELRGLLDRPQQYQRRRLPQRLKRQQFKGYRRLRHSRLRRHLHRAKVLLRASRGDSKPCYWHRHVISTASSTAVV